MIKHTFYFSKLTNFFNNSFSVQVYFKKLVRQKPKYSFLKQKSELLGCWVLSNSELDYFGPKIVFSKSVFCFDIITEIKNYAFFKLDLQPAT